MRLRLLVYAVLLTLLTVSGLSAQVALLEENFDDCVLPPGWQVNLSGNPDAVWYVADAITNDDNNGQGMNGSCFLFIDDDASGDQTPPFVLDFVSPPFDASQHPTVELSLDVHYRDWGQADEFLDILVTDGITETRLVRFDKDNQTGSNLDEFVTLKYDLALVSQSPNLQLIIRYDDANGFNWWAGVDNISVTGKGSGANVIVQTFDACAKPAGWETDILSGDQDWSFGQATNPAAQNGTSINGSCMAYFDDDILGDSAPYSAARLYAPWFDGTAYGQFELQFDLIHRFATEIFSVYVQHADGAEFLLAEWAEDIGGPYFNNYVHQTFDLSPYRAQQMRLVFQYNDGNGWGWWTGLDNVKVTGSGAANDLCANAVELLTGAACLPGDNRNAVFDGPPAACANKTVSGLWYRWQADFTGIAQVSTQADFNDVVNVFTGGCALPQTLVCNNRDEHGFLGETTRFNVQAGTSYLLRVSGQDGGFGRPRGSLCLEVDQVAAFPTAPANDNCPNAVELFPGAPCVTGSNVHATMSPTLPSLNQLARADVWYKFTATGSATNDLSLESGADFSDIITVYSGGCANLSEVTSNHRGQKLLLENLTDGQTYWVQIAGNFATVEGGLCAQLVPAFSDVPDNDQCLQATAITVNGPCVAGNNFSASFSGYQPPCVVEADRDIWFKFTAPATGSVRLNTGADFDHVLALWEGNCAGLTPVFCAENPRRCDGYPLVGNLVPGQTYFVQIAAWNAPAGFASGNSCLQVLDGANPPPFQPLDLQVQEQCIDVDLARLAVSASGGVAPYEFLGQSNGQTLASGSSYLVIVTDAIGCEQSLTGIADDCTEAGCLVAANFTAQSPLCATDANGTLTVQASGGAEPYAFLWSSGSVEATQTGLAAGTYLVTITDAEGCQLVALQALAAPPPVLAVAANVVAPHTGQSDGAIDIDASGGTGVLSFTWMLNGQTVATTEDLTDAPAGDYVLIVSDQNGCSAILAVTLTSSVGTSGAEAAFYAEVWPNPLKDKGWLTIKLPATAELQLALSDGKGRQLRQWSAGNVQAQNVPLDLGDLPTGLYWLKITAGTEMVLRKVVVAR